MSTFASGEKSNRRKCYVCQYCLCYFVKKEKYDLHVELCVKGGHQYELPHKEVAQFNFPSYCVGTVNGPTSITRLAEF